MIRQFIKNLDVKRWFHSVTIHGNSGDFIIGHPHGILCCGMVIYHFESNHTVFAVAPILFYIPIFGWLIRHMGLIPASKYMIQKALRNNHKVILMVGGIEELISHSNKKLYLEKRWGYLKIAKETGKTLTPVWIEGEFDTFYNPSMPFLSVRQQLSRFVGMGIMFPWIFGWYGTWLPKRKRLTVHFGDSIEPYLPLMELKHQYHASLCRLIGKVYEVAPREIAYRHGLTISTLSPAPHLTKNDLD